MWDEYVIPEGFAESRSDILLNATCELVVLFGSFFIDYADADDAVVLRKPDADGAAIQDLLNVVSVAQRVPVALRVIPEIGAVGAAVGDDLSEVLDEVIPVVRLFKSIRKDVGVAD